MSARRRERNLRARLRSAAKAGPREAYRGALLRAVTADSPLAVGSLSYAIPLGIDRVAEVRTARVESLVRIAQGLPPATPWDTYGDSPFLLEALATTPWGQGGARYEDRQALPRAGRERLLLALSPHLPAK